MILSLNDVAELKKEAEKRFPEKIHFHDGCGGQYFTVDILTPQLKEFIVTFFAEKNLSVLFSEDGAQFTLEEIK